MSTIYTILEECREAAVSKRDLGDKFERLFANYLLTDPLYVDKYSRVWLWNEWPGRKNKPDVGIDLVAQERYTGESCAIQCKFYDPSHTLQKADIDSFFTASGKAPFTSRIIVSTTDNWSKHAEDALLNQRIPVIRMGVQDLANSPVDWSNYSLNRPQPITLQKKKELRPHQTIAREKVIAGFQKSNRGKLIMACGTGKTFTTLKIAEHLAEQSKRRRATVLFLVPSISLLSQSLREWSAETKLSIHSFAVCSDTQVGKTSDGEDISIHDLAFPATTDGRKLAEQFTAHQGKSQLDVVFSTYHSVESVAEAQAQGVPEFDLIICDEAHRTTGVTLDGEEESHFLRVHDQKFIKGKKRLYMTATPRIFNDSTKVEAQDNEATLCSMDDESIYGPEFHRLGFSEAVRSDLLADYKVMVLAVDEKYISKAFQAQIADKNNEISLDDAVKITGCWNGLSKRMAPDSEGTEIGTEPSPMRSAVAFSRSIRDSKRFTELFGLVIEEYRKTHPDDEGLLLCETDHVDGSFNALKRTSLVSWLKTPTSGNVCRVLSNARCLTEGVDVPALDAVMFLNPRSSVVDVVQSVGRVMRKAAGKKYGYIILPIGIPADMTPEEALQDNQKYKVVWQVLQALRAHDDRFNATINQIELNRSRPDQIQVIGISGPEKNHQEPDSGTRPLTHPFSFNLPNIEEWRDAIYAKIVVKCGDRRYWESWAKDVAQIADRHVTRIKALLDGSSPKPKKAFDKFLTGLQHNLNPSVTADEAIEMLSQHLITKPVFDALFEGYAFTQNNPVSLAMQNILDILEDQALAKETTSLDKFYASVKERATGIDTASGKQKIVLELYDKFFRTAFPRMAERLGIVYTPVEVVDFILQSADEGLRKEFGVSISDRNVHILDPFAGTGTFMVRLLQSGLISKKDLLYKYRHELHTNEIVLLAYYIAAINIEETFHDLADEGYQPFQGIVLTDTFQMTEGAESMEEMMFPENNKRAAKQKTDPIRVIVSNPPYSAQQDNENDGNKNAKYPELDRRIRASYAASSSAGLKKNLYDSYVRAIRWASDRIEDKGVVCYVSNGSFIDSNYADGMRKCLTEEFTSIYCFNLRGNQRTAGELSRMEGGKIFGSGSRAPIAITLLIKNPKHKGRACQLHYHDIGDYLDRETKLQMINDFGSIGGVPWTRLTPNAKQDWINQRDPVFETFIPIGDKSNKSSSAIFSAYSLGVVTNRDAWAYNFSTSELSSNMTRMIDCYNKQAKQYRKICGDRSKDERPVLDKFIDTDPKKISWTRSLKAELSKFAQHSFDSAHIVSSMYRPFCKQRLYFNRRFNEMVYKMPTLFPDDSVKNLVISLTGIGGGRSFSALITDCVPNLDLHHTGQCFPLYRFADKSDVGENGILSDSDTRPGYVREDAISDTTRAEFRRIYGKKLTKEDIFYYVYGILHSQEYKQRFASDLKKALPRIPFAQDFLAFSNAGRSLARLHLAYETVEPYPVTEFSDVLGLDPEAEYAVRKMAFGRKGGKPDKTTIVYNSHVTLTNIPELAYEYIVNGKPALEWIMERYQFTIDKDSQIANDPNTWSDDPRYIIDLVKRIVRVSIESMRIVKKLPPLNERKPFSIARQGAIDAIDVARAS
ncbi:MAG TPA: type ISP restriction/modification enzyme [Candidatus Acidoferrales bacterium]|nr:type ISP restriction/modification enzyme [Candidatus Acidoferrales bacterium]